MYKSLCIVDNTLYLCRAKLPTLIAYLNTELGKEKVLASDKAQILFKGNIVDNIYSGTFDVLGTAGTKISLKYLDFLKKNNPDADIMFSQISPEKSSSRIDNVVHLLILEEQYDSIDIQTEVLI